MPSGLRRYHDSGQSHFITFTCYHRHRYFTPPEACDLFLVCLENMRRRFQMCIYGFVVMPEHVHLLMSEPRQRTLADAIHYLKLSFTKRFHALRLVAQVRAALFGANLGPFWQKRYYDRNIRDAREFTVKLRYLHRNPVQRGLVSEPAHWRWSSFRHYALREIGVVEIESEWTARDREVNIHGGPTRVFLNPG